ncbi:MAG: hypothetical protein FK732_04850, partial [Asgard group archaeon]|nr:hypothetical protein [Asgard group archaeon]
MSENTDLLDEELGKKEIKPKTRHIVEQFVYFDAITKDKAIDFGQLGLDLNLYENRIEYLLQNNIILPKDSRGSKYYLDYDAYQVFKEKQDKRFFMIIVSIVIPAILFLLLGIAW